MSADIAQQLQLHGALARGDIRTKHLATSPEASPVMATPVVFTAGLAAAGVVAGAFTGGFAIGHAIG